MTRGRSFRREVEEASEAWSAFESANPEFAAALTAACPDLSTGERSLLREVQPWFEFVADSGWFRDRLSRSGESRHAGLVSLLREELARSLPRSGRVRSTATVRAAIKEARRLAVGVTPEPDFDAVVNIELRKIGWTEAQIRSRRQRTESIIRESIRTGRTAPEEHLQNLMFQRIETERMIEIARGIAARGMLRRGLTSTEFERQRPTELGSLIAGLPQKLTEVTGEIAATSALMNVEGLAGLRLQLGFAAGTGFDQVWVRLDEHDDVTEIVIVEAKGPGAELGQTRSKGRQMSAEWVVRTVLQMLRSDRSGIAAAMIAAIERGEPPLRGLVVTAKADGAPPDVSIAPGSKPPAGHYPWHALRRALRAAESGG